MHMKHRNTSANVCRQNDTASESQHNSQHKTEYTLKLPMHHTSEED